MTGDELPKRVAALIHDYLKANVRASGYVASRADEPLRVAVELRLRNPRTGEWETVPDYHEERP